MGERRTRNKVEGSVMSFSQVFKADCPRWCLQLRMWQWNALSSSRWSAFCLVGLPASFNYECGLGLCNDQMAFSGKAIICPTGWYTSYHFQICTSFMVAVICAAHSWKNIYWSPTGLLTAIRGSIYSHVYLRVLSPSRKKARKRAAKKEVIRSYYVFSRR